ncbi:GntR family transcriptional regulator [Clostridium sp. MCC353]|uniref:GntR family transcriptional regulator n=1 Tax=Clostridium sp. MCC353 TaxID=2592646 RepID=UPI0023DED9F7|nr:GntR family transcriptional regulator [Clostridium sp. MCC353]
MRENIMQVEMKPGEIVNEVKIAEELNISRTPVHEAVYQLKEERLIEIVPRKESKVTLINMSCVNEGFFIRCAVEPSIIRLASNHLSPEDIDWFYANLEQQKVLQGDEKKIRKFFQYDDEFHKKIYMVANKPETYASVQRVISHLDRVRYFVRVLGKYNLETVSYEEHLEVFNMLLLGVTDKYDLNSFIHNHIIRFADFLPMLLREYPYYFNVNSQLPSK